MGRHADPDDDSFRRSLLRALGGGVLAMVVTFGITAALTLVGREDLNEPGPAMVSPSTVAEAPTVDPPQPTEQEATDPPTAAPEPAEPTEPATPDDPSDVTVQVLDIVGNGQGRAALDAQEVLLGLGYDVVALYGTDRTTDTTVILYTKGHRDEAEALRQTDDRFTEVRRNDGFSNEVDLHVLVAEDFAD
jgi:hypothetical protein